MATSPEELTIGPAVTSQEKRENARRLVAADPNITIRALAERAGIAKETAMKVKAEMKDANVSSAHTASGASSSSGPVTASLSGASRGSPPASPRIAPPLSRKDVAARVAPTYKRLGNMVREPWDDPNLPPLTDQDARDFAEPFAETLELMGHTDKVKYLAPGELLGVLYSHWGPALKRVGPKKFAGQNAPQPNHPGEPPPFRTPPGMAHEPPGGPQPPGVFVPQGIDPSIGAGIDRPTELSELNTGSY